MCMIQNLMILASIYNHISRKKSVNAMDEMNIPMHDIIFCCGWDTKSLHTIFSYFFTSISNEMRCGKTPAHWFLKMSSEIYGGLPTTLDDNLTDSDKATLFVNYIFVHNTGIQNNKRFKRILAAYILIFHDAFIGIIGNEPSSKYKNLIHHTFHQKILSILSET